MVEKERGFLEHFPKANTRPEEQPLAAAIREFQEEIGFKVSGPLVELGSIQQKSGKLVLAWAFQAAFRD